jgi:hypothetical protein
MRPRIILPPLSLAIWKPIPSLIEYLIEIFRGLVGKLLELK